MVSTPDEALALVAAVCALPGNSTYHYVGRFVGTERFLVGSRAEGSGPEISP